MKRDLACRERADRLARVYESVGEILLAAGLAQLYSTIAAIRVAPLLGPVVAALSIAGGIWALRWASTTRARSRRSSAAGVREAGRFFIDNSLRERRRVAGQLGGRGAAKLRPSRSLRSFAMPKKYKDVRKALIDAGWTVLRQKGSHEVWVHADRDTRIVVAGKDSNTVPVGTLSSIRRASGLEHLR